MVETQERTDCVDLLLDLVFYENYRRRLSPEMEYLLQGHLDTCPDCRDRMLSLRQILGGCMEHRNYG